MKFAELQEVKTGRLLERLLVGSGAELDGDIKRHVIGDSVASPSSPMPAGMQTNHYPSIV